MSAGNTWQILVIDDNPSEIVRETIERNSDFLGPDIHVMIDTVKDFDEGKRRIQTSRFDLIILDLRNDDSYDNDLSGLEVYDEIKASRFVPIVCYTALPEHVRELAGTFVKVVERGEEAKLLEAIKEVFVVGLMQLNRDLEEEQRKYMWGTTLLYPDL